MLALLRFIPLSALILGISCLLLGLGLQHSDPAWMAQFVGQTGVPNPKLLEKVRLMPWVLTVTSVEALCLSLVSFLDRRRTREYLTRLESNLRAKQKWMVLCLSLHGLIGVMALNFGSVSLWQRMVTRGFRTNEELVAADFGEHHAVIEAVREQTPQTACILIRTQHPIKYLLNYHLFPRRLFIYPDPHKSVSDVSVEWLQEHAIDWTLEIDDGDPTQFELRRAPGFQIQKP
jgi:hypothetical protein